MRGVKKFLSYLIGKKSEVADLEYKDALLAKVVLDIHRSRTHKSREMVRLYDVRPVHRLDRDNAMTKTLARIEMIRANKDALLSAREITFDLLAEYLPSVSWIKVVRSSPNELIAFEGNGRLEALQRNFSAGDGMLVEVEQYHFTDSGKILRRLNRVRKANNLLPDAGA